MGLMASVLGGLGILHPYSLAMACGVGSGSMMAASSANTRPATMAKSMGSREMPPMGVGMVMVLIPSNTTTMTSIARCRGQFLAPP